jgi:hypothetical protein
VLHGRSVGTRQRAEQPRSSGPPRGDEFDHGQGRINGGLCTLRQVGDRAGANVDSARQWLLEAEHEPKERRLAAAVWARDRNELTRLRGETHVAQDERSVSVRQRDVVEANG